MEESILQRYHHPFLFYGFSMVIPWILWFVAGYVSHLEPGNDFYVIAQSVLGFAGLLAPVVIAFFLMYPDKVLWQDLKTEYSM